MGPPPPPGARACCALLVLALHLALVPLGAAQLPQGVNGPCNSYESCCVSACDPLKLPADPSQRFDWWAGRRAGRWCMPLVAMGTPGGGGAAASQAPALPPHVRRITAAESIIGVSAAVLQRCSCHAVLPNACAHVRARPPAPESATPPHGFPQGMVKAYASVAVPAKPSPLGFICELPPALPRRTRGGCQQASVPAEPP